MLRKLSLGGHTLLWADQAGIALGEVEVVCMNGKHSLRRERERGIVWYLAFLSGNPPPRVIGTTTGSNICTKAELLFF